MGHLWVYTGIGIKGGKQMGITLKKSVFDSIPEKDYCNLFDADAPRIKEIAKILDFKREDISVSSDVSLESVRYNRMPAEVIARATEWAIAINLVAGHFQDLNKTILWFRANNPMLGDISPRDMIKIGRFKKLLGFIQISLAENKPTH